MPAKKTVAASESTEAAGQSVAEVARPATRAEAAAAALEDARFGERKTFVFEKQAYVCWIEDGFTHIECRGG